MVLALVEAIKGIIGWSFMIFFIVKYSKLNKLNVGHQEVKVDTGVMSANEDVRKSVVVQLTNAEEIEDPKSRRR